MMHYKTLLFLIFIINLSAKAQQIAGYVKDAQTREVLIGVGISNGKTGTMSNNYGFFSMQAGGRDSISFSMLGYQTQKTTVKDLKNDAVVLLSPIAKTLDEFVVTAEQTKNINTEGIGTLTIPIDRIKKIPALFGETDIIKALSLTPGVMIAQEGTSGLLVRGGSPDQNLILLDEAPVYNVSHLFGLASIFNPDAVKNVTFYKSDFPARFGGRLSSVIDVQTKNGNAIKKNSEMTLGMLSSRFLIEGPIKFRSSVQSSYLFTARSSYLNLFTWPFYISYKNHGGNYINYWLYDVNAKINTTFKNKSSLFLSFYAGLDRYKVMGSPAEGYDSFLKLSWFNRTSTIRYTKPLSNKLFFKLIGLYTNYQYINDIWSIEPNSPTMTFFLRSQISDLTIKSAVEYFPNNKHEIRTGLELTHHRYQPTFTEISNEPLNSRNQDTAANEISVYAEDNIKATDKLSFNLGLRGVVFLLPGKNYYSLEPRASANLQLPGTFALKAGYARQKQFVHQLSNTLFGVPNDIWVPITDRIPPQQSQQFSVGLSRNLGKKVEASIEVYQKSMTNLIDLQTGANFIRNFNQTWEDIIETNGIGDSKGFEAFLNKTQGKLTGWISYTLSRSRRRFDGINEGEWYDFAFDRRHSVAITGNYQFQKSPWSVSASWVFQTGAPVTVHVASQLVKSEFDNEYYFEPIYEKRNNFRMPNYHRMDVSFTKTGQTRRGFKKQWVFGLYNAYSQINPFYLKTGSYSRGESVFGFPNDPRVNWEVYLEKQAFLPILPFVSYTRSFTK